MPRTLEEGFRDFLTKLTPSSTESAAATSHRKSIHATLDARFGVRRLVRIGSFGNGTSISGFSDVDYLACLRRDSFTANSASMLRRVREVLEERFPFTGVKVDSPAVVVPFGNVRSETTEVVPADEVGSHNGFPTYDIADGAQGWMKVSPDTHNAYVRGIDERLSKKVKPLIRFIKAWKYLRSVPISSFYLELRIAKYAETESFILYHMDIERILRSLLACDLASMRDPTGVSGLVHACRSQAELDDARSKLATAATRAAKAEACRSADDIGGAFEWWRILYGEWFPTYYY